MPYDLQTSKVLETRTSKDGRAIRRRRECLETGRRFTTVEALVPGDLLVIKRDGRREPFGREKIHRGLLRALQKRPVSAEAIEQLIDSLIEQLERNPQREIPSSLIGEAIMTGLKELDPIAYIRFTSVYRGFEGIEDLKKELESLT